MSLLAAISSAPLRLQAPRGAFGCLAGASVVLIAALTALYLQHSSFSLVSVLFSLGVWIAVATTIWGSLASHPHEHYGHANTVTTARALSTAILAGFIPVAAQISSPTWLWIIAITATITLCMDGLDGYLARKTGLSSAFGARFDMETDALLALVITLFLWQSDKVGIWVLGLGVMRYAFLAAAHWCKPLNAPLYPSLRRKTVCVIQVGALCLMLCPWLSATQAVAVGALALLSLSYSFAVDVWWLLRQNTVSKEPAHITPEA